LGPATREKIEPGQMPLLVKQAFIAAEDRRFYDHNGVDLWGIGRALVRNVRQGAVREGASTITQQLARTVYLGSSAYGLADAAWVYFSKTPEQLNLQEAALIAGLPPAPSVYSPLVNPELALERRAIVLDRMQQAGFITKDERDEAKNSPLDLKPAIPKYFNSAAPFFTSWVAQQLPQLLTPEQLEVGGLKIRTSLNLDWQKKAQQVVRKYAPFNTEGAIVSMEPGTGLVRVMVGGKSFSSSQFNRATQALRSPGSTFKLFPYAAAIDAGVKPEDTFMDAPRCWSGYCPKNFGNKYFGKISLAEALKNSLNTVAVQLQDKVGFDAIIATANQLGIGNQRPLGKYYPMAIGAYEQTVLDMTAAYAAVANRGVYVKPMAFEEIRGPEGNVLWSRRVDGDKGRRALDSDVADAMNWMLQRVVTGGTGAAARLDDRPVAGKTGTSEGARDLWFIGSIPQLTTAVWFGYDNNAETKSNSGEAAWAWKQFMNQVKGNYAVQNFPPKPVLTRTFKDRRRQGSQRAAEAPLNGDQTDTDSDVFSSGEKPPEATTAPPRYVAPAGGPPVDEFFRPLPVQ
ncbi:MAG: transglycosylase domain-containing protein, partial [Prochlorococcaceae cyanobacterium]